MELHGTEPRWRVEGMTVDRVGETRLEIAKPWTPSLESDGDGLVLPPVPDPPVLEGYSFLDGKWKILNNGGWGISYTYGGVRVLNNQPGQGGDADGLVPSASGAESWSFEGTFRQDPITTHPNWLAIKTKYGWVTESDGTGRFPPKLPSASTSSAPGLSNSSQTDQLNPLYGVDIRDVLGGMLTREIVVHAIPANLIANIGKVVSTPWSALGTLPEGRDWRIMAPSIRDAGNVYRVGQRWELSGPGGWNPDLFTKLVQ